MAAPKHSFQGVTQTEAVAVWSAAPWFLLLLLPDEDFREDLLQLPVLPSACSSDCLLCGGIL